ncbi:zinc finger protein 782 [Anopheles bellator]|uniref:zinc finger protein 782 n=1 Tax=Anopheles bellator TaxID=139047 RepID=UPI0026470C7F|nr:zinc finger protein 782 [Anopheles bellator]
MTFANESTDSQSENSQPVLSVKSPEVLSQASGSVNQPAASEKNDRYKCEFCGECFRRKDSHDRHRFTHTGVYEYACSVPECGKAYTNRSHLKRHVRANHTRPLAVLKQNTVDCEDTTCKLKFSTKLAMKRHYQTKHVLGKPYACDQCDERFWRKLQLKFHKFKHTDQYPHRCEHCEKGFVDLKSLRNHRCHHNLRSCADCSKKFTYWSELVAHRRLEHSKRFRCEHCPKVFHTKRCLKAHARSHITEDESEMFECPYAGCPRFYRYERNLYAHVRSKHEGVKKYVCEEPGCGRVLATKQKLELHRKLHQSASRSVPRPVTQVTSEIPRALIPTAVPLDDAGHPKIDTSVVVQSCTISGAMSKTVSSSALTSSMDSASESEVESGGRATSILTSNVQLIHQQIAALRAEASRF